MINQSGYLATQIEVVDTQHKKLFKLVNELTESYHKNGTSEKLVDDTLRQLVTYADKYFLEEEELMLRSKIDPGHINVHRMEHRSFIYDVNNMLTYSSNQEDLSALTEKLVGFITSWLTHHILATDRIMEEHIFAIQHGASSEKA